MYSESDLNAAVDAGALSPAAAASFRAHVAAGRSSPAVDEEQFRLVTGFNDIFVTIAIVLLFVALGQLGAAASAALGAGLVTVAAWGLAEYFTGRRRMALPSIVLLLVFVGGIGATLSAILYVATDAMTTGPFAPERTIPGGTNVAAILIFAGIAATMTAGAWAHWRRFHVPITIAAGAASAVSVIVLLLTALIQRPETGWIAVFAGGVGTFALAMRWDLSDRERRTRRSDVAFWLHLAAAPMIAHPIFHWLGVFGGGEMGSGTAIVVLALYLAFAAVALAIDRRALLVSGLAYVLYAMAALIRSTGAVELSAATTALVIGSALLCLSAFWQTMRRPVVASLGGLGERLPPVAQPIPRPA